MVKLRDYKALKGIIMKKYLKITAYGVLTWLIPFVVSFFFYDKNGNCLIDIDLFKSIMIVVSALAGCGLLVIFFRKTKGAYLQTGIAIGVIWLLINLILDALILLPMSKMPIDTYIMQIGVRYLNIPIICIMAGALLETKKA
ncbi:MAG: hypothetical protein FWD87_06790 [Spirochaetaceae bacterium]|nr:hypothetical protein [Spirochaetaceae bacterium]